MLVSMMARFNAINTMNNAQFASMQASNNMMRMVGNMHTFEGDNNLETLHEYDNKFSSDIATNSLLYRLAALQEKIFAKMYSDDLEKHKVNYIA